MDTLAIIKRIELRLAELGMSKADFYKQSGISSASYSQWNTGKYKPSDMKLKSAAECLGVSFEYLCYGNAQNTKKSPTTDGERFGSNDILDEVDIAFYGDFKELDENDKETVRDMVRIMRERRARKQE
jgi:transcriptional regulator with XRE-family HTH domain